MTREANERARSAYEKSIELDPGYARAYGGVAFTMVRDYRFGWSASPNESLDRALALAQQAVTLGDNIPQTYWVLGYVHLMRREYDKAERAVAEATRIAPNHADGYGLLALINNNLGRSEEAIEFVTKGMELNPYYTWDYLYNLGRAYYQLGRFDEAVSVLEKAQLRNENAEPIKLFLATSYVRAGRIEDAEWVVDELLTLNPATTVTHTEITVPMPESELKNAFLEDLRKAGLPE